MACIGDASRFRLVEALLAGARCVTDLATEVGLSQSCTTRHLQALERRRVVCGARDGKRVMYRLCHEEPALGPLLVWALSPQGVRAAAPPPVARRAASPGRRRSGGTAALSPARRRAGRPAEARPPIVEAEVALGPISDGSLAGMGAAGTPGEGGPPPEPARPPRPQRYELEDYLL